VDRGGEGALTATGEFGFRAAGPADAAAIGRLHVASWRETYAGLLPASSLAALSAQSRSTMWQAVIEDPACFGGAAVFVAETGSAIAGFACCGNQRDPELADRGFGGEIGALYVLRTHQRLGVGRALMRMAARSLIERRYEGAALWVLETNRSARSFYETLGGMPAGAKIEEQGGATLREVAYGWSNLALLDR